ncbi:unnamed protein product [Peronospora belbahrii]|uniref:Transmembrane protein 230 n=1 Tax=Peronospora belbahrii TaxID=622444 RepID=A0AAU9L8W0_9STRA|nr:unnamed protein product [Peronospora belbahrii]CAH0515881.1 unnamed protein product [Peronospora belbahrii]
MAKDGHYVQKRNSVKDSELASLVQGNASETGAATPFSFRRKHFPLRTGLAAISLLILGSILIYMSILIGLDDENRGLSILSLGLIAFIPGSYATYQLYGAWKGWKGYHYDQIPSYDD